MSVRFNYLTAALCLGLLATACSSTGTKRSMADMSEDEIHMAMAKYGTPNENHKKLDPLVGKFTFTSECRMTPDKPFEKMNGTAENNWSFGNRYIETSAQGAMMGMPFEGHGYWGYDNASNQYCGFWMDNFSTGMMPVAYGDVDSSGTVFTFNRQYTCPITGQEMEMREVLTIKNKNEHMLEMFTDHEGKEFKSMSIQFKRS